MTSFEDRIRDAHPQLSPSLKRLGDFLLDSYIQASFLTATELAHTLDIDPATVVRFSQRLGYPGYPELQREIREKVRRELLAEHPIVPDTPAEAAATALAGAVRHLDLVRRAFPFEAAEKLLAALDEVERVIVLSEESALAAAEILTGWLEAAGYSVHLAGSSPTELARAIAGAGKGDLVLATEVSEETPFVARALAEARARKVLTAALVGAPSLEAARYADILLSVHASPEPALGQLMLVASVYALCQMLAQARPGRFLAAAERVGQLTRRLGSDASSRDKNVIRPRRGAAAREEESVG
jgi:DNA-binding MurR/RpiR family transcriptional regulator